MPQLPRVESQRNLTTQQPSPLAPKDTNGEMWGVLADTASSAADTTYKWQKANSSMQKTQAELNMKTQLLDIHARAEADPDKNAYGKYASEVDSVLKNSPANFSDPQVGAEARMQFDYEAKAANIQLNGLFRKKQIESDQVNTKQQIDMLVANPTESSMEDVKKLLAEKKAVGIFGEEAAYNLEKKANDDLGKNRLNKDLYSAQTPEAVDQVIQQINEGFYEKGGVTLDSTDKKNFLEIADRAKVNVEKKMLAQHSEAITNQRMETIVGISSNDPQYQNVDLTKIAETDPQLAGALAKTKDFMVNYNPKLPPKEQSLASAGLMSTQQIMGMKNYAKSIMDVFMQNDNEKLGDFVVQELEKKGDGLTPSVKIAAFSNLAYLKSKVNAPKTDQDLQLAGRFTAIKNAVMFLKASNPFLAPQLISDFVVKNFLSGSSAPDKVMHEAKDVLKTKAIEKNAALAKLPFTPNKVVDGDAPVEDLHDGLNDLDGETYSGSRADTAQE